MHNLYDYILIKIHSFCNYRVKRRKKLKNPRRKRNPQGTQRVGRKRGVGMSRWRTRRGAVIISPSGPAKGIHYTNIKFFLIVQNTRKAILILERNVRQDINLNKNLLKWTISSKYMSVFSLFEIMVAPLNYDTNGKKNMDFFYLLVHIVCDQNVYRPYMIC